MRGNYIAFFSAAIYHIIISTTISKHWDLGISRFLNYVLRFEISTG